MTEKLAEKNFHPRHRVGERQQQTAALRFADDRVIAEQKRNQWDEEDRETGNADDTDSQRRDVKHAGRCGADKGQRKGQCRKDDGGARHPFVA